MQHARDEPEHRKKRSFKMNEVPPPPALSSGRPFLSDRTKVGRGRRAILLRGGLGKLFAVSPFPSRPPAVPFSTRNPSSPIPSHRLSFVRIRSPDYSARWELARDDIRKRYRKEIELKVKVGKEERVFFGRGSRQFCAGRCMLTGN